MVAGGVLVAVDLASWGDHGSGLDFLLELVHNQRFVGWGMLEGVILI